MNRSKISLISLTLLLAAQPLHAQEADALTKAQSELNALIQQSVSKLSYIRQNASKCTSHPTELNLFLIRPLSKKFEAYKETLHAELKKLTGGIQSKKGSFDNVNACTGYKATAIVDFKAKQKEILRTRSALENEITQSSVRNENKLYFEPIKALSDQTGYVATVKALSADASFPGCPAEVLNTFRSFAEPYSRKATLNAFNLKMQDLNALLTSRSRELDHAITAINKTDCESVAAEAAEPMKAAASTITEAPIVAKIEQPGKVEVAEAPPLEKPVEVKAPVKVTDGSAPVVGAILAEEDRKLASVTSVAAVAPVATGPEALSASDKWTAPKSWKSYDEYKASINAPNRVTNVNVGQHYTQFLSSNSVQVRSEEDAIRFQKAINAASMQVNGDGVGISVYQDGRVGARTMSAAYMMQNDPVYRPVFLAELRRQGLIRN